MLLRALANQQRVLRANDPSEASYYGESRGDFGTFSASCGDASFLPWGLKVLSSWFALSSDAPAIFVSRIIHPLSAICSNLAHSIHVMKIDA